MANKIITAEFQGSAVDFTEDAWFNATEIAANFGKRVDHWLENKETTDYIEALCKLSNTRKEGYLKTRRGSQGGTWMHPKLGVAFARWLDVTFGVWCDEQIYNIITGKHPHYDWKKMRSEATSSSKVMHAILEDVRKQIGKDTASFHYSNEHRMVNHAITGKFEGMNRESLSSQELDLLARLEMRNTVLIGKGMEYKARKVALELFAEEWAITNSANSSISVAA